MIKSLSRLLRLSNLGMVFLTMYLLRWSIVRPILEIIGFEPQMPEMTFFLLVLSTVLITAAGNVINDYHDIHADRLNNPEKVVVGRQISRRQAIILHLVLNIIGIALGIFISFYHRVYWLSLIFAAVPTILWFYSTSFKHRIIIGNLIVSVLTATVPLLVALFEYPLLRRANPELLTRFPGMFDPILYWLGLFALFAFLTNLIREVLKDAADYRGDKEVGSKTIAVVFGRDTSRIIAFILGIISITGLGAVFLIYLSDWMSLLYFAVFLALPFLILLFQIMRTKDSKGFHRLVQLVMLIMLTGLLYAPVAYFVMKVILN